MIDRRQFIAAMLAAAIPTTGCNTRGERPVEASDGERIVGIGGVLTEMLFALGVGGRLVGSDTSSYYPDAAAALPKVGYQRQIAVEGVIGLAPTLVVHTDAAGPPGALAQLASAGIELAEFPEVWTIEAAKDRIRALAARVDRAARGDELIAKLDADLAELAALKAKLPAGPSAGQAGPSVVFVYARGADVLMVGGRKTAAASMIELAGGRLAFAHDEFMPLSAEAVIQAAPELLLVTERGLGSVGGEDGLLSQPGLAETPAGRAGRVVAIDDLALLGFGPRTGETLLALARAFHPELA
jgi:iron complex transport system substrate-binding protein